MRVVTEYEKSKDRPVYKTLLDHNNKVIGVQWMNPEMLSLKDINQGLPHEKISNNR